MIPPRSGFGTIGANRGAVVLELALLELIFYVWLFDLFWV